MNGSSAYAIRVAAGSREGGALDDPGLASSVRSEGKQVVRVRDLHKTYGTGDAAVHAVSGMTFDVAAGEIVGVLGPNGAGKTTGISCLEGLVLPDAGEIEVFGLSPFARADVPGVKLRTGVSMQNGVLPPLLKVRELLTFKAALYPDPRPIDALLDALGLSEKADMQYRHLSGGQQQRTILAMALVGNPDLLLLDEPTSQLDPQARRVVWEMLDEQRSRRDAAVLITTHQMEEAQRICDRVIIVDHGKVIAEGTPTDLVARYCPARTVEFSTSVDSDISFLADADAVPGPNTGETIVKIRSDETDAVLHAIVAAQQQGRFEIGHINITGQTLEDVFIKLTGREIHA